MLTRAFLPAAVGLSLAFAANGEQPPRTRITHSSDTKSVYENVNTGPMRTTLTRENKFPEVGQAEVGGFFSHTEFNALEQDSYGVYGRYGFWEFATLEASVPFVDSDFNGDSNSGLGDVVLKLDLIAYQDIFQYPFVIPHIDVSLPTGDEDDGLGTGETVVTLGVSVGTKVYDVLTYVVDLAYAFNGGNANADDDNVLMLSGSLIWDISDRFAVLTEGRVFSQNRFDEYPYQVKGGMAYRFTPDVQLAVYGGVARDDTNISDDQYETADVRLAVQF